MKNYLLDDEVIQKVISNMELQPHDVVIKELNDLELKFPADDRVNYLQSVFLQSPNSLQESMNEIWKCLSIQPNEDLYKKEMSKLVISNEKLKKEREHNLEFNSGERQTSKTLDKIRFDHTIRYKYAASMLTELWGVCAQKTGLDLFSGNGYGSRLVHNLTGSKLIGVDGSLDAVVNGNKDYGNSKILFFNHYFPFNLPVKTFDFSICFESLEHVESPDFMLEELFKTTQGPIFISVPAEETLPFSKHKKFFKFNHKHYKLEEIINLLNKNESHAVQETKGQIVYRIENDAIAGLVPQEEMYLRPVNNQSQFYIISLFPKTLE